MVIKPNVSHTQIGVISQVASSAPTTSLIQDQPHGGSKSAFAICCSASRAVTGGESGPSDIMVRASICLWLSGRSTPRSPIRGNIRTPRDLIHRIERGGSLSRRFTPAGSFEPLLTPRRRIVTGGLRDPDPNQFRQASFQAWWRCPHGHVSAVRQEQKGKDPAFTAEP
jgi:hypothetical protein